MDASALIAALAGEDAEDEVRTLLRTSIVRISSTNLAEVYDRLIRRYNMTRSEIDDLIDRLIRVKRLVVIPLDDALARDAGELRATHYHHLERSVSHADCVAASIARDLGEALATTDPNLAEMARELDVEVIALPDSSGNRP